MKDKTEEIDKILKQNEISEDLRKSLNEKKDILLKNKTVKK